ncbi:MAG: alpha/beta fold hydrolase [Oscillatoriales cyanobacterium]|nr:MAG: alpha/beta fold hydrolase [Oscillatoriales cyanobacterium]
MRYFYLHGFASGPQSFKARDLAARFRSRGQELTLLDFNDGGFADLTLTRQIQQVERAIAAEPSQPVTLIGSSFGGLTALWVAERCPQVARLVLLAPALGFPRSWHRRLLPEQVAAWERSGELLVYHYGEQRQSPLKFGFLQDADRYDSSTLRRSLPTLILHGRADETVSINLSRDWVRDRNWVELIELDTDHGMGSAIDTIWQVILKGCNLPLSTS